MNLQMGQKGFHLEIGEESPNGSSSLSADANGSQNLEGSEIPNARQHGKQIGDWEILLSQNNYSIDYVRTASGNIELYEGTVPGFAVGCWCK